MKTLTNSLNILFKADYRYQVKCVKSCMLATKFIAHSTMCDPSVSVFIFFGYFHVQLYYFSYRSRCSFAMVDSVLHWCYSLPF